MMQRKTIARTIGLLACLALLIMESCTTDVVPATQSIALHFNYKIGTPPNDSLFPLYPNPFSTIEMDTTVTIRFTLEDSTSNAYLLIQNVLGDEVATYTDSLLGPGIYSGSWNPITSDGTPLKSGLYFVTLRARDYINSRLVSIQNND